MCILYCGCDLGAGEVADEPAAQAAADLLDLLPADTAQKSKKNGG